MLLGRRNPPRGAATKTTQVVAKTAVNRYATKVANNRTGGATVATCRSAVTADFANPKVSTPCLRVSNTKGGEAFRFHSAVGALVGVIQVGSAFAHAEPQRQAVRDERREADRPLSR